MNDAQPDSLHEKIDAHALEVERFHAEVASLTRQVANCDKLIKLGNASLGQIDQKIAEAIQISAQAQHNADAAGLAASQAATAATSAAVHGLLEAMNEATAAARTTGTRLNILQFKTGWWITLYAALTLLCCLLTGFITSWALRGNALTPEQARYVELGKAHETVLDNASERELKLINAIRSRPPKTK
ncbi:hypothetical protein HSX11_24555 [Oxalobacteraceae bacterium]|nr:hypothetical protein [Oxalobacteraceae bacterium]